MKDRTKARIAGCWLGKAIGGTLGGPHEGRTGPLDLDFYEPVPTSLSPNDDLDLQIVWLHHLLASRAREVTPDVLSEAWGRHVGFPFDEYAVCLRNRAYGLRGHALGAFDNWFSECMGAAIRSEIWACVAPGDPERAAALAWADAACDHAGDGVWAEVFLAALESAAFVESDRERLLDRALDFLPAASRVSRAVGDTRAWWRELGDWRPVRARIMEAYGEENFTDVAANLAFTVLGWLAGEGDFGRSILVAANCGQDTDCTAATLGSLLGILDPDAIPARWSAPIGEKIVLSPQIKGFAPPATLEDLTARTLDLAAALADFHPSMGPVVGRAPASEAGSPVVIPAKIGWWRDGSILTRTDRPPEEAFTGRAEFPGHWTRRRPEDFAAPVQLLSFRFRLDEPRRVQVCAWSQSPAAVWVDGIRPIPAAPDWTCNFCRLGAPSFHRGGPGNHEVAVPLDAGEHDLTVALPASAAGSDFVVGVAGQDDKQWLPWALAKPRPVGVAAERS